MTIAATGGVMVGMVGHASQGHAPAPAAMMLSVSVASGVLALIVVASALTDWQQLQPVYRTISASLVAGAAVALARGWLAPPPWLQISLLTLTLGLAWLYSVLTWYSSTSGSSIG
jgi:hypothetical protein